MSAHVVMAAGNVSSAAERRHARPQSPPWCCDDDEQSCEPPARLQPQEPPQWKEGCTPVMAALTHLDGFCFLSLHVHTNAADRC